MSILRISIYRWFFILLFAGGTSLLFSQTPAREYQIKAVLLFNFTQFVEWPAATPAAQEPLVIGVLGQNPFGAYLKDIVAGEKVNGHELIVQYYGSVEEIKSCHILFINMSETNKMEQISEKLKSQHVLTVSDGASFMRQGGMVRFITKNNKTQLQINLNATKAAQLIISSKLLRLAEIYSE